MRKLDSKSYIKYFIFSLILGMIFISDFKIKDYYETKTQVASAVSYYETGRTLRKIEIPKLIVIDAGHGDFDSGSENLGYFEKDINLELALKLEYALKEEGYAVIMTRNDDSFLELYERSDLANETKADLFISIHQNSYMEDSSVNGIEVYYNSEKSTDDEKLAKSIQDGLINETRATDREIRADNGLVVIRETTMPSVLIETAYISNKNELSLITSDNYQDKVIQGIIAGIEEFFNQ
ncbi:MAG: N-acetylmuramoyl-L-alanine amidase [Turicibacter sp.]|nr:N-acetylmuramoyl-L-alanine amidase [Turicibacter sp.]